MVEIAPPVVAFLARFHAYAERAGKKPSYISRKIFNDGKAVDRLKAGGDIGVITLERAQRTLDGMERAHTERAMANTS